MSYETILYEERGPVSLITYNRPDRRNAWSVPAYREAVGAIEEANANEKVGAIVITGAGPVFCAGADFKAPPEPPDESGRSPTIASLGMAQDTSWLHLLQRSKPSIFAVGGRAVGVGATQTLAGDIRMAGESASFSFPFLKLGTMPEYGATALLTRLVGFGRALDLCLTAAEVDAEEALRIGLVTRVVPDGELVDEAVKLATEIAEFRQLPVRLTKEMIYGNVEEGDTNALLKRESMAFISMFRAGQGRKRPS